jgi:hypothetical protein
VARVLWALIAAGVAFQALALLCGASGCGPRAEGPVTEEVRLVREEIRCIHELANALEQKAPEARVQELRQKLEQADRQFQALPLSDDEKKDLVARHKDEITRPTMRLVRAGMGSARKDLGKLFGAPAPGMPPGKPGGGTDP